MFLHEDKELFRGVIEATAEELKRPAAIVEKDYYVTMILKLLSEKAPECVFKGGTSLSKCHHAIDRFSEDIDIAFSNELTQGQRKHLKNEIIAGISQSLGLPYLTGIEQEAEEITIAIPLIIDQLVDICRRV